jgi:nuclear transport factor 2 (NTF2) superfamily protein
LKEVALDRTLWRTRFGRGYGPVVRQTTEWMNDNKQWKRSRGNKHVYFRQNRETEALPCPCVSVCA